MLEDSRSISSVLHSKLTHLFVVVLVVLVDFYFTNAKMLVLIDLCTKHKMEAEQEMLKQLLIFGFAVVQPFFVWLLCLFFNSAKVIPVVFGTSRKAFLHPVIIKADNNDIINVFFIFINFKLIIILH